MMNNDQLFDEMVRAKSQQQRFNDIDAGWEKMQALLPPERKRPVVGLRIAVIACLLAAFLGGSLVFLLLRSENEIASGDHVVVAESGSADHQNTGNSSAVHTSPKESTREDAIAIVQQEISSNQHSSNNDLQELALQNNVSSANVIPEQQQLNYAVLGEQPDVLHTKENTDASYHHQNTAEQQAIAYAAPVNKLRLFDGEAIAPLFATLQSPERKTSASSVQWSPDANYWFLQAGATYTAPLTVHSSGGSFSPVAGIGYNVWINPAWSLQAGLRYSSISNLEDIHSMNSIGSEHNESTLQRLHSLSLPLQVWKRAGYRHAFSAGYTLNFIAAAQLQNDSYTETNGLISNEQRSNSFTQSGFSRFDGQFTAGYSFTINNRMQAEVSAYAGLTDIMHNSIYGNNYERNRGILLLLNYSF